MDRTSDTGPVLETLLLVLLVGSLVAIIVPSSFSFNQGPNNRNVSIDTKVNITGSAPTVTAIYQQANIILGAGGVTYLTCNASIRDYNGYTDVSMVNATFFHASSSLTAADDNNTHYTNTSCAPIAGQQSGFFTNYTCTIPVMYYALNGSWNCTVVVNDSMNFLGNLTAATTINPLYALNVTVLVDFGNLSAGDYSANQTANITNLGNLPINISVYGYGRTAGDNLSFVCDQGNLSIGVVRFSANISDGFAQKQSLNSTAKYINNLTLNKTSTGNYMTNTTYWQMYADPLQPAFGQCNGTIVFRADPS